MDLLRSQFTKYDSSSKGIVSVKDFKTSLERFGIRDGLQPVIKKFSRDGVVDYNSFMSHFQNRQKGPERSEAQQPPQRGGPRARSNSAGANRGVTAGSTVAPSTPRARPASFTEGKPQGYEHSQQRYERMHEAESHRDERPSFVQDTPPKNPQQLPSQVPSFVKSDEQYSRTFEGIDIYKNPGVLDVHRSDSGSLAAFALGEINENRVDSNGTLHVGKRRRGSPVTRAHDATLPTASVACLNGFDEGSVDRGQKQELKRRGHGTAAAANSPGRGYDLLSGTERIDREDPVKREGKRHVQEAVHDSPHKTVGVRTYGDNDRPFREARDTPKGLRTQIGGKSADSHFAVGNNAAPSQGEYCWPEGPKSQRVTPSTVSAIPGLSSGRPDDVEKMRRKGRTKEPSSFGYQLVTPRSLSPGFRTHRMDAHQLKGHVQTRVSTNSPSATRAWMELNKSVGSEGKGLTPEQFATALQNKYSINVDGAGVRELTNKNEVQFSDFNKILKPAPNAGDLLRKVPDRPAKITGRRYHSHDREDTRQQGSNPPFATMTSAGASPARRGRSSGPTSRVHPVVSVPCDPDHYTTTNMRTFSPVRGRTPTSRTPLAAGFPNKLRDDSMRRKRCFSPGMTNRESAGNPITHH